MLPSTCYIIPTLPFTTVFNFLPLSCLLFIGICTSLIPLIQKPTQTLFLQNPTINHPHWLMTYSNVCWGTQLGNVVREENQLPLFKFRSMSGAIVFQSGGPITWKTERQDKTSLSSCKVEIWATNAGSCLTMNVRNIMSHLSSLGYPITDIETATTVYNNNEVCINWCHNMTTKGNRHIEHQENAVKKWVEDASISVSHISGKCNPFNIFTKEMRDGSNFRLLWDSLMS
jgi:hypothetical protein